MADHFAMDGIADYSIISGLQTTYIQRSTTPLNRPICRNGKCKKNEKSAKWFKVNFFGEEVSTSALAVYRPKSLKRSNQMAPKKLAWRDTRQKRTQMKEKMPLANE